MRATVFSAVFPHGRDRLLRALLLRAPAPCAFACNPPCHCVAVSLIPLHPCLFTPLRATPPCRCVAVSLTPLHPCLFAPLRETPPCRRVPAWAGQAAASLIPSRPCLFAPCRRVATRVFNSPTKTTNKKKSPQFLQGLFML